jgi:ABC-type multidrug transport system fused ATPase/permease subunit
MRNSPILILDEPTSGLDAESERKVIHALKQRAKGKTLIVVTHQLQNIMDADCIVVLSQGKIAEMGTHEQLIEWGGIYSRLWRQQMRDGFSSRDEAAEHAYAKPLSSNNVISNGAQRRENS